MTRSRTSYADQGREQVAAGALRDLLSYNGDTGRLYWAVRPASMFADGAVPAERACRSWNTRYAGKEAFTSDDGKGYRIGAIFGRLYNAHRVVWALVHGAWPDEQIDHINGDRSDNRLANLRCASVRENARNTKRPAHNSSGVIGVNWRACKSKWRAYIAVNRHTLHLGYFDSFEAAVTARRSAEKELGFHPNHGRVARVIGSRHA